MTLILASGSATRRRMLHAAGLVFEAISPPCDEEAAKAKYRADGLSPSAQAEALAELKALSVHGAEGALIIGADQMLVLEGEVFDKPKDSHEAREHLRRLRGRTHELATAAVVSQQGRVIWRCTDAPRLSMRDFSDAFLDTYIENAGADVLQSVGGYQLEGLGAQLFSRIEGDHFSVLGLPLLPLLAFLREQGEAVA